MRLDDWETRMLASLERHRALPFIWGESDCWSFMMDNVEALLGEAPHTRWTRHYKTARGALGALRKSGYVGIEAAIKAVFPGVPASQAQRGDLCLITRGGEWDLPPGDEIAGGVLYGTHVGGKGLDGVMMLPLDWSWRFYAVR